MRPATPCKMYLKARLEMQPIVLQATTPAISRT